jgi:hypothetical protein
MYTMPKRIFHVHFYWLSLSLPSFLSFLSSFFSLVTEEMAERDSELAEAHRRRSSNASSTGVGSSSTKNHQHHVTGFLASQTLDLFLAVPHIQPAISNTTAVRYSV